MKLARQEFGLEHIDRFNVDKYFQKRQAIVHRFQCHLEQEEPNPDPKAAGTGLDTNFWRNYSTSKKIALQYSKIDQSLVI